MEASYHRHDISDNVWALLEPHLPPHWPRCPGKCGSSNSHTLSFIRCNLVPAGDALTNVTQGVVDMGADKQQKKAEDIDGNPGGYSSPATDVYPGEDMSGETDPMEIKDEEYAAQVLNFDTIGGAIKF